MTLAAGFKFEQPKAQGVSPILLLSDSRYSSETTFGDMTYIDDGKKIYALANNIFAVFAGDVLEAQNALAQVKKSLDSMLSGSFEDLKKFLNLHLSQKKPNGMIKHHITFSEQSRQKVTQSSFMLSQMLIKKVTKYQNYHKMLNKVTLL